MRKSLMSSRGCVSLYPAPLFTHSQNPTKSNVSPTYPTFTHNPFVSPTYAKTGGCPLVENVGAPDISSLFSIQEISHPEHGPPACLVKNQTGDDDSCERNSTFYQASFVSGTVADRAESQYSRQVHDGLDFHPFFRGMQASASCAENNCAGAGLGN